MSQEKTSYVYIVTSPSTDKVFYGHSQMHLQYVLNMLRAQLKAHNKGLRHYTYANDIVCFDDATIKLVSTHNNLTCKELNVIKRDLQEKADLALAEKTRKSMAQEWRDASRDISTLDTPLPPLMVPMVPMAPIDIAEYLRNEQYWVYAV